MQDSGTGPLSRPSCELTIQISSDAKDARWNSELDERSVVDGEQLRDGGRGLFGPRMQEVGSDLRARFFLDDFFLDEFGMIHTGKQMLFSCMHNLARPTEPSHAPPFPQTACQRRLSETAPSPYAPSNPTVAVAPPRSQQSQLHPLAFNSRSCGPWGGGRQASSSRPPRPSAAPARPVRPGHGICIRQTRTCDGLSGRAETERHQRQKLAETALGLSVCVFDPEPCALSL